MFGYTIRSILNRKKKRNRLKIFFSFVLLTGCRRLETDDGIADELFVDVTDVNFVSTIWLSIWPVVVANRRSIVGSV